MATTQQRFTLDEFLRLPESEPALEYADGEVTQKVSPKGRHSRLQLILCEFFQRFTEDTITAVAFPELRTTFAGRSYVPDVAVYRWDRVPVGVNDEVADDFLVPPDIAVEVVSPGQGVNRLVRKCLWYVQNGVGAALIVDPDDHSVVIIRAGSAPVALGGSDRVDLTGVLPGVAFAASELFEATRLRRPPTRPGR